MASEPGVQALWLGQYVYIVKMYLMLENLLYSRTYMRKIKCMVKMSMKPSNKIMKSMAPVCGPDPRAGQISPYSKIY